MTRRITCGWESGNVEELGQTIIGSWGGTSTVVTSVPTPRSGGGVYVLKMHSSDPHLGNHHKMFTIPAATEIWVRWALYTHLWPSAYPLTIAQVRYSPPDNTHASLEFDATDGYLRLRRGSGSATVIGSSSPTIMAQDNWHVLEWRMLITSATTGASEVWLDGNRVINYTGDVSGDTAGNVLMDRVRLGIVDGGYVSAFANTYVAIDDIAINDTVGTINNGRPGDGRVVLLLPNGAGSSTSFTRGGTDTGANWSQVNEIPASMTQYVESDVIGARDLYALANLPTTPSSISVVQALALGENSDAGGGAIGPTLKSGSTIDEYSLTALGIGAQYIRGQWEVDPNTSAAWTASAVNALEGGVTVR